MQPIFDAIGRETLWLGPAGQGTRMKLVLNNWLVAQVEAVAETVALTEALGLDPHLFPQAIDDAPLGSPYAVAKARTMISGDFSPGFALRLAFKDADTRARRGPGAGPQPSTHGRARAPLASGDRRRPRRRRRELGVRGVSAGGATSANAADTG